MDIQTFALSLATLLLVTIASTSGWALLGKRNYLLGGLWFILAFSGLNFLLFGLYGVSVAYDIANLCDVFSRGLGIPVVATAGLMAVTHRYRPSVRASLFVLSMVLLGTALIESVTGIAWLEPCFRIGAWAMFSVYLWYFAKRLADVGEYLHAIGVSVALFGAQVVVISTGIVDTQNRMFYFMIEGAVAAYLCLELFYAYCALERRGH
ncbi:hypothetical protein GM658_05785 [Pseudoduganella eburnea]|uniref:Uncharacterized protein n=1 Tax=Massilia eburnea TaxID=1776165 RepID=A0A6L6QE03_9BURK|nr:hypothetical protein [Massilia eburnea]MTW10107.1 hypothetical protein [Massilia eburnea]